MNKVIILLSLLLVCGCTTTPVTTTPEVSKVVKPLPEITKPTLSPVKMGYKDSLYTFDKKNISIMYDNYRDIIDYSLQEKAQLDYYRNMLK